MATAKTVAFDIKIRILDVSDEKSVIVERTIAPYTGGPRFDSCRGACN